MSNPPVLALDAVSGLLLPISQVVIGLLVVAAVAVSVRRRVQRGPSRMSGAMLLIGGAVVCLAVITYLFQQI
jgi:hypothetical protein